MWKAETHQAPWEDGSSEDGTAEGDKTPVSGYAFTPADGTQQALADTELKIAFEGTAPELGTSGCIRIYRMSDHKQVDEINMAERRQSIVNGQTQLNTWMDIIGVTPTGSSVSRRIVNYYPARVEGKSLHYQASSTALTTRHRILCNHRTGSSETNRLQGSIWPCMDVQDEAGTSIDRTEL